MPKAKPSTIKYVRVICDWDSPAKDFFLEEPTALKLLAKGLLAYAKERECFTLATPGEAA